LVSKTAELFQAVDDAMCAGISEDELDFFISCLSRMQQNLKNLSPEVKELPFPPEKEPQRKG
jgi:hypothetical protein